MAFREMTNMGGLMPVFKVLDMSGRMRFSAPYAAVLPTSKFRIACHCLQHIEKPANDEGLVKLGVVATCKAYAQHSDSRTFPPATLMISYRFAAISILAMTFLHSNDAHADDLIWMVNAGGGQQSHSDQDNRMAGADLIFYQRMRSERQEFVIGVGYTDIHTNAGFNEHVQAISIFPQLNLYAKGNDSVRPMFFVRALGPTWLSNRHLGDREQGSNFTFQAQVGAGLWFGKDKDWLVALSYKHFSNAGLTSPNEAFDVPVLLTLGYRQKQ